MCDIESSDSDEKNIDVDVDVEIKKEKLPKKNQAIAILYGGALRPNHIYFLPVDMASADACRKKAIDKCADTLGLNLKGKYFKCVDAELLLSNLMKRIKNNLISINSHTAVISVIEAFNIIKEISGEKLCYSFSLNQ